MILTKSLATITVAWHGRAQLVRGIRNRINENGRHLRPVLLLFLLVFLGSIVAARITLANDMRIEAEQTAAAEALRLDQEKQEAIRAATIAAEQAKAQEAAAAARADREAVARVLYGTALHHSADAQRAVCWCIINRTESSLYPNTITEVCAQPSQWMGYADDNPVIESLYKIADEVLSGWQSGGYRAVSPDYLFLSWTADEIILRTTFSEGRNTHYWRVG